MKCTCFLLFFKKIISSYLNIHEGNIFNDSMKSPSEDKKRKDNDEKIQKRVNKKFKIENKITMAVDLDKGRLDPESEKLAIKELQNFDDATNEKLEQNKAIEHVSMYDNTISTIVDNHNGSMNFYKNNSTNSDSTEPLDLSCKSKYNIVCSGSNAPSFGGAVVYNFIRTDDIDKKVDFNLLESSKNIINANVKQQSQNTCVDTNTSEVFVYPTVLSHPDCTHSYFTQPCTTICYDDQELIKLLNKLEKNFFNLKQAKSSPEFNNIYIIDSRNISYNDINLLKKFRVSYNGKFYNRKKKIIDSITNICEHLKYQQISRHRHILVEKSLKFICQVFVFINDFNFFKKKRIIGYFNFFNRLQYQKYKFTALFSNENFAEMITLIKKVLYQDHYFNYVKKVDLKKSFKSLSVNITYIINHLKFYTDYLNEYEKIYMKYI